MCMYCKFSFLFFTVYNYYRILHLNERGQDHNTHNK